MFVKGGLVCLVLYMNDIILAAPNLDSINKEIREFEVSMDDQVHPFQLHNAGHVGDFLQIRIDKLGDQKYNLTQLGLTN